MASIRVAAAAALLTLCAAPAPAQTADEIIEKHLAAIGGREALGRLRTRVGSGTITLTTAIGPVAGTIESFAKTPNKSRTLITIDLTTLGVGLITNDQRFDGTTGYVIDTFNGNRDITGQQLQSMRNNAFPTVWLDYQSRGITMTLVGKETLGDRPTYVLEGSAKTAPAARAWVDAETYMVLQTSAKADVPEVGEVDQITEYADFRIVDGVKVPFQLKVTNPTQMATAVLTDVKHNVEIDDALFLKP